MPCLLRDFFREILSACGRNRRTPFRAGVPRVKQIEAESEIDLGIVVAALEQLRYIAKLPVIMQIPLKLANGSKAELFDSFRRI